MITKNNRLVPFIAIHPGEILEDELIARGISTKDFAVQLGISLPSLISFLQGKLPVSNQLASKLEELLGIPSDLWLNLYEGYLYDCKAIEEAKNAKKKKSAYSPSQHLASVRV